MLVQVGKRFVSEQREIDQGFASGMKDLLSKSKVFQDCHEDFIRDLIVSSNRKEYAPNRYLMEEGARGDSMFVLFRGVVEVTSNGRYVCKLRDGSIVGEAALLSIDNRRTASIRSVQKCDVAIVFRSTFHSILEKYPWEKRKFQRDMKAKLMELGKLIDSKDDINLEQQASQCDALKKVPFFAGDGAIHEFVAELAMNATPRWYRPGKIIIQEGDTRCDEMYVLLRGAVEVTSCGEFLGRLENDLFGEIGVLDLLERRTASVTAATQVHCMLFARQVVIPVLAKYPDARLRLLEHARRRLVALNAAVGGEARGLGGLGGLGGASGAARLPGCAAGFGGALHGDDARLFAASALLREARVDLLAELSRRLATRRHDEGRLVASEDEAVRAQSDLVCWIVQGQVELWHGGRFLGLLGEGEVFGDAAVFAEGPQQAVAEVDLTPLANFQAGPWKALSPAARLEVLEGAERRMGALAGGCGNAAVADLALEDFREDWRCGEEDETFEGLRLHGHLPTAQLGSFAELLRFLFQNVTDLSVEVAVYPRGGGPDYVAACDGAKASCGSCGQPLRPESAWYLLVHTAGTATPPWVCSRCENSGVAQGSLLYELLPHQRRRGLGGLLRDCRWQPECVRRPLAGSVNAAASHVGMKCSRCGTPWSTGPVWKCAHRLDYQECDACHQKHSGSRSHEPSHVFIKEVLSEAAPRVLWVRDFLTPAECDHLIRLGMATLEPGASLGAGEHASSMLPADAKDADAIVAAIEQRIGALVAIPPHADEDELNLVFRPEPRSEEAHAGAEALVNLHLDARLGRPYSAATVLVYLNDVECGGGTVFPCVGQGEDVKAAFDRAFRQGKDFLEPATPGCCAEDRRLLGMAEEMARGQSLSGLVTKPTRGCAVAFWTLNPSGPPGQPWSRWAREPLAWHGGVRVFPGGRGKWLLQKFKELPLQMRSCGA